MKIFRTKIASGHPSIQMNFHAENFTLIDRRVTKTALAVMFKAFESIFRPSSTKYCYELREGSAKDVGILGVKGSQLCEISRIGLPTPAAFILSSEASLLSIPHSEGDTSSKVMVGKRDRGIEGGEGGGDEDSKSERNGNGDAVAVISSDNDDLKKEKSNSPQSTPLPEECVAQVRSYISRLEEATSKTFGSTDPDAFPLLLSVRCSGPVEMRKLAAGSFPSVPLGDSAAVDGETFHPALPSLSTRQVSEVCTTLYHHHPDL
jgi:hypothetical protein